MKKTSWTIIGLFLALCVMSAACQKKSTQTKRQELRMNLHTEPPTLDPRKAGDTTSCSIINMCFEGLYKLGTSGEALPALAERVEISEDQKTYTFYLRKADWSDGMPITAKDFEETWKSILHPLFNCYFASDYYLIKNGKKAKEKLCSLEEVGIRATGPNTLVVELEHPAPYFLSLISSHSFVAVPAHIVKEFPNWAKEAGERFVGNGPFVLKKWRHYNEIVVEKNPRYWDRDKVRLERISLPMIADENTELSMFENGELDWAGKPFSSLPSDALPYLTKREPLNTRPIAATYFYIFNTKSFPFHNVHIRRAFALAVNRQEIIENVLQGLQLPATGMIPPIMWKYHTPYFQDADLQNARKELALGLKELKLSLSDFPTITLSYNTAEGHHKIAQAIQGQWLKALGIRVKLENKEWKVFLDDVEKHQFQIARMGAVASFSDPVTFLDLYKYKTNSNNHPQWNDPLYTELMEKADQITSPAERMALLKQAETLLIEQMPIIPLYFYTSTYLKKPYVKGLALSELGDPDFRSAYIEQSRQ